jgi:hypothetical protein
VIALGAVGENLAGNPAFHFKNLCKQCVTYSSFNLSKKKKTDLLS